MYFSREINFVINVSVWVYLIYFNRIKVTLPADRRTMAIGRDSSLAAERSVGMLNNNPIIHHGVWGVGRLCSSWGEAPRSSSQPGWDGETEKTAMDKNQNKEWKVPIPPPTVVTDTHHKRNKLGGSVLFTFLGNAVQLGLKSFSSQESQYVLLARCCNLQFSIAHGSLKSELMNDIMMTAAGARLSYGLWWWR